VIAPSVAACLASEYDRAAERYRLDDEIELLTENHQRLGGNLRRICQSFPAPIRVLEIGCGTGRFFHWLDNTALLVGTDVSAGMLERARNPVRAEAVSASEVRLIHGDIHAARFDPVSFDFIFALGVFGYGVEFTADLGAHIHRWLAPGGRFYFDAIDELVDGRMDRVKQGIKRLVFPCLPSSLAAKFRARDPLPVYYHSREQIERRMSAAGFSDFALSSNTCKSPLWSGSHIECMARKSDGALRQRMGCVSARTLTRWQSI
jgi:SAM-dependent methyltransferase